MQVKQGDSSHIQVITHKIDNVLVTDYTGYLLKMEVLDAVSRANAGITRTIAPDIADGFLLGLSPVDTAALAVGEYIIVADLEKTEDSVLTFNRELSWTLRVIPSLRNDVGIA